MKFTYDLNETRATDGRPYNVFFIFRRGDSRIARFVCNMRLFFRDAEDVIPAKIKDNSKQNYNMSS